MSDHPSKVSRRTFHQAGAAAWLATTAASYQAVAQGPNDVIRLGVIGVANRGSQLMDAFNECTGCEIVALCDVDSDALAKANDRLGEKVDVYRDFRKLIERNDIDGVVIATPDHWHAVQMIEASHSGKDVYVEKPLSVTVVEGRRMVEVARQNKTIVQVGTHRRSSPLYAALAERVKNEDFGKICVSRAYRLSNMVPDGIGRAKPTQPPANLDWDMWLGPRPERPYQDNIAPYKFRWWEKYSSQVGNWGVHYLDAIRWCTDELAPSSVCAMGGRFAVDDDRTIPDTMQVCYEFESGRLVIFGQYETSSTAAMLQGEVELRGTQATVFIDAHKYQVVPERGGQFQDNAPRMAPETVTAKGSNHQLTTRHAQNFLDCMRSRKRPAADVEIGHRSTTMSLIATISRRLKQRLAWDAQKEQFIGNDEANSQLHYEYRSPWKLG